jgi:hypothetical protein
MSVDNLHNYSILLCACMCTYTIPNIFLIHIWQSYFWFIFAHRYQVFIRQGVLLSATILFALIFNINIAFFETSTSIFTSDFGIWKLILDNVASLLFLTTLFNLIPIGPIARLKRDAQFDTLEKYGLAPSYVVTGVSLLLAIGAGVIEAFSCLHINIRLFMYTNIYIFQYDYYVHKRYHHT